MAQGEPEDVFKVTDRRRRLDEDEPAPATPPRAREDEPPHVGPAPAGAVGERSLAGLFMMLASSAVVALGDAPDPLTGQRQVDLAQAADAIDLLILLREKTEGHRSPEENQILEEVLYDLQLRYVHATKRS
ncbi:MAG: DUF1844 domain-containing protein [Candidatus Rokuibacteriota bacterium]|nr:MAG: DUF1844 domain-containing protein [Candidatus Rokubacteria bacterium]